MYHRLLLLLTVLFVSGAAVSQDVMTPADGDYIYDSLAAPGTIRNPIPVGAGTMQKWVHDTAQKATPNPPPSDQKKNFRISWDQTNYKSYRWGNLSFRLRFPNNYNPAIKYPAVVFLHGQGETADLDNPRNTVNVNRENQDQLYWGAQLFEQRINTGEWNGFLLFPHLMIDTNNQGGIWNASNIPPINNILDTLEKYNGLDPDRVTAMGLSAGGFGCVNYASLFPQRIAGVVSASPRFIQDLNNSIDGFLQIPVWIATGALDNQPDPATTMNTRNIFASKGGNIYISYYPSKSHETWQTQWVQNDAYNRPILTAYWNFHKAQPMVYFQNNQFCEGQPIDAKLGLTPNFFAYEWQYNNGSGFTTISGATTNIYTATQPGTYRARFKRVASSNWSEWSPTPVLIITKKCTTDTLFTENFEKNPVDVYSVFGGGGSTSYYNYQNFNCQNGVFTNASESFTQDATGRIGGKFLLHNTYSGIGCEYHAGDQVWRPVNEATVTPNTDYLFSFYMGNENLYPNSNPIAPLASLTATINDVPLTPANVQTALAGNVSWRKYSFIWNSGNNTTARPAILNAVASATGNSFAIDEISLVKYKAPVMPGNAFRNVTLWAKANSITGVNGVPLGVWTNSNINGNNLQQNIPGLLPLFRNNGTDNINFNPVVALNTTTQTYLRAPAGFSGNQSHNAAHIYMVAKFNNTGQIVNVAGEGTSAGTSDSIRLSSPGVVTWKAGDASNTLVTPANTNEANKVIQWTFSKDNLNNTGNGNKQDIRKNGIVVASTNASSAFTGNNSEFRLGTFDGNLAEVIYILDSLVTPLKQNQIESYLALKYGTTLGNNTNPVNYTASDGTAFWTGASPYQNDVFGIGTDSASGLVQTISNSVNTGNGAGTGQSQKGNLVLATNTTLADKRFLVIGNDAAALTQEVIAAGQAATIAVGSTRISREWKVANTGGVGAVDLSFDTTGLGNQAGGGVVNNYTLMIDNNGDGDFNTGTLSFFNATSAAGKKINFSGVALNNGVVFTIITLKSALLPAVWLGFTAEAMNGNALLKWKTSDEMNVDRYSVEHSFNGVSFSIVGAVAANNNTGVNEYTFTHYSLAAGLHYYRIRRIDKDGRSEYTDIKTIKIAAAGASVLVRPNPVVGSTLVLAVSVQQSSRTNVQVMGVDGKIILQQQVNLTAGTNLVNLNIATVPAGIYMVQVKMSDEVVTRKFIRQQ